MLRKLPTQRAQPPVRPAAGPASSAPQTGTATAAALDRPPAADPTGTGIAVVLLTLTAVFLSGTLPQDVGRFGAYGAALALGVSLYFDSRQGLRSLIRADVLSLVAYYFLTFFEFLFPQPNFDSMVTLDSARVACVATLLGMGSLMLGRHLWQPRERPLRRLMTTEIPTGVLVFIFWFCFVVGYLHMAIATDFDFVKIFKEMTAARFTQSWQRGRLGDWKALVVELGMFIYLIPPLAGIMFARRQRYGAITFFFIVLGFAATLFYGFVSGTRNVFATYLVTFLIGYSFSLPQNRQREIYVAGVVCVILMGIATPVMLAFRNIGVRDWLSSNYTPGPVSNDEATLFVDYNILAIAKIMEAIPEKHDFLGLEVPYIALVRPIPRAVWPGKPEGLSYTIEDAYGTQSMTVSATFVGEAYMAGGYLAVLVAGLALGALAGWWSHLVSVHNSELGILIYASGFFAAVITMRSAFQLTTALLPTIAAIALGILLVQQIIKVQAQLERRRSMKAQGAARLKPGLVRR